METALSSGAQTTWVDRIGVPAWVTSPERILLHVNARAGALFGCRTSACVGRRCYDVLGGHTEVVSSEGVPEPFCRLHCPVQHALARGRALPALDVRVVAPGQTRWIHLLPIPVEWEEGRTAVVHCALPADKERRLETYLAHVARRSPHPDPACLAALSPREEAVLKLLANDLTLGEISERLGVSYVTVRNHVQHVLTKLCAHSIAEAIAVFLLGPATDQKSTVRPRRCVSPSASGSKR